MSIILYTQSSRLGNKDKKNDIYQSPLNTSAGGLLMCRTSLPMRPFFQPPFPPLTPRHVTWATPNCLNPPQHQVWGELPLLPTFLYLPKHPCFFHLVQLPVPQGSLSDSSLLLPLKIFSGITYSVDIFGSWVSLYHRSTQFLRTRVSYVPLSTVTGRSKQSLVSLAEICIY